MLHYLSEVLLFARLLKVDDLTIHLEHSFYLLSPTYFTFWSFTIWSSCVNEIIKPGLLI